MLLVHIVLSISMVIGLLALYAPKIEKWNMKHLLSNEKK